VDGRPRHTNQLTIHGLADQTCSCSLPLPAPTLLSTRPAQHPHAVVAGRPDESKYAILDFQTCLAVSVAIAQYGGTYVSRREAAGIDTSLVN
jgi:hypothetical protein